MKRVLVAVALSLAAISIAHAEDAPKTKQVCHDAVDKANKPIKNKDGTVKQNCKTIKVHKKYEGTAVPTTPPKPAAKPAVKPVTKPAEKKE